MCKGVSFNIANSKEFKDIVSLVQKIRVHNPGVEYESPSAFQISNRLLDELYVEKKNEIQSIIAKSPMAAMTSDGLTNIRHEHMLNFLIKIPNEKPIYYKTITTNGEVQDGSRVAIEMKTVMDEIGDEKIGIVITDNAPVMKSALSKLEEENPLLTSYGCACHVVNLLVKDLMKKTDYEKLVKEAESIVSFVNNHHRVFHLFKSMMSSENVSRKLFMHVKTRWFSLFNFLQALKDSKALLKRLVQENQHELSTIAPRDKSRKIVSLIKNVNFWKQLDKVVHEIEYPSKLIGKLEANDATCEIVHECFLDLFNHYLNNQPQNQRARDLVVSRYNFIVNDHLRAAYMLNHGEVMRSMSYLPGEEFKCLQALEKEARRFGGDELAAGVIQELPKFHQRMTNLLPHEKILLQQLKSVAYWGVLGKAEFPALSKLAGQLLGPAAAAISERHWSIYRFIHTRLRNRLGGEKVDKISFLIINEELHNIEYVFEMFDGQENNE